MASNPTNKALFFSTCVDWDRQDVDSLLTLIDTGREITFERFRRLVDTQTLKQISQSLGYGWGRDSHNPMRLHTDYHVRFFTGKLDGVRVPYFVHSAIEHVFLPPSHPRMA